MGKLYICKKKKLPSVKVEELDDKEREDLVEVSEKITGKPKVR